VGAEEPGGRRAAALDLELTHDEVTALEEPYVLRQATWF
jgi:hypothetical protein